MVDVSIENGIVITINAEKEIMRDRAVVMSGDRIVDVGATSEIKSKYQAEKILNAKGMLVMPGLVDTHTHLFQTLGKGLGDDMALLDWFVSAWKTLAWGMNEDDYYNAALLGCVEAIKTGTTCLLGFEHMLNRVPEAAGRIIQAFSDSGIRGILARGMGDSTWDPSMSFIVADKETNLRYAESAIKKME